MGKWADALAAHLAETPDAADEKTRHPPTEELPKPTKGAFGSSDSTQVGGCRDFSYPIGGAANEPARPRTCADCRHRLRPRTCGEPVAAGLFTAAHGFGIVWPEPDHAATCPAFAARIAHTRAPAMRTENPLPHPCTNGETE